MLMIVATSLFVAANTTDAPQTTPKSNLEEIVGEDELQVFETDDIALDDSSLSDTDPELVEIEE